jgi:hypothetical protein
MEMYYLRPKNALESNQNLTAAKENFLKCSVNRGGRKHCIQQHKLL